MSWSLTIKATLPFSLELSLLARLSFNLQSLLRFPPFSQQVLALLMIKMTHQNLLIRVFSWVYQWCRLLSSPLKKSCVAIFLDDHGRNLAILLVPPHLLGRLWRQVRNHDWFDILHTTPKLHWVFNGGRSRVCEGHWSWQCKYYHLVYQTMPRT